MSYRQLLTHRCDIYTRETQTSSGSYGVPGQDEESYALSAEDVPCYFTPKSNQYLVVAPGVQREEEYLVHFLPNVVINVADRVEYEGDTFELRKPRKVRNHHIEVIAVRVKSYE